MNNIIHNIPHTIFIVPYKNRIEHKELFNKYIIELKSYNKWSDNDIDIYYSQQCNNKMFNRGAIKNIGFIAMKNKYPNHWKNITFIFHDIDSIPNDVSLIPYKTMTGKVAHYYGYKFSLGGIFAIKGIDFEKTNGFPNFWGWGFEDNIINNRIQKIKSLIVDRDIFYDITDTRINRPFDGFKRKYSKTELKIYNEKIYYGGLSTIYNLNYEIINEYINIYSFITERNYNENEFLYHDVRNGSKIYY